MNDPRLTPLGNKSMSRSRGYEGYISEDEIYANPNWPWDLNYIAKYQYLSPEFLRNHQKKLKSKLNWKIVSRHQILTPALIREFQDKVNWKIVSRYQKMKPSFILEFQDKVDWKNICKYQTVSNYFKEKNEKCLKPKKLAQFKKYLKLE